MTIYPVRKACTLCQAAWRAKRWNPEKRRRFCGAVTVSERGRIVVLADARRVFGIQPGDKLLVFGDLDQGIAFAPFDILRKTMQGAMGFLHDVGPAAPNAALPRQKAPRSKKR